MESNLKNQLMDWACNNNLNWLINFHNYVRALLKDQLMELGNSKTKNIDIKIRKNALYDYDRTLHANTFLMMYSYLEEWLYHCRNVYVPNTKIEGKGSLGRFKDIVKKLGIDLTSKLWQDLKNAEKIRNCLLHANGRISLLRDPQEIKKIIEIENSGLEIKKDRVVITGVYLQRLNENISEFLNIMNNKST